MFNFRSLENTNVQPRFFSHIYSSLIARTVMWSFSLLSPLFKSKSLIMKNISTGFGLCAIAATVALYPVLDRFAPISKEAHAGVPVSAITSAVMGQAAPTIVWYQVSPQMQDGYYHPFVCIYRAWSDGRIEFRRVNGPSTGDAFCAANGPTCASPWFLLSDSSQGYSAASDSNFDSKVDGTDLSMLLGNWGDAPRHDIPPSDCPLNLINP